MQTATPTSRTGPTNPTDSTGATDDRSRHRPLVEGPLGLVLSLVLVAVVAAVGGSATATGAGSWYRTIEKPPWNPPDAVFGPLKADPAVVQLVLSDVKKKLTPQPVKIRADIEVQCFTYEGIEAVRAALMAGLKCGTEQYPIFIKLIAPPLYVMLTSSLEKADGIKSLETAIAAIEEVIRSRGGKLVVKQAPRATSTQEENALASLLEQIEAESRMVDGDDDDDDDDGGISGAAAAGLDRMAGAKGGAAPAGAAGAGAEAGGGDSD